MISSPSADRDVQQELIAEIHRTAIWPVVVTVDGNISEITKTDFIDRDGSYIILIPDGNLKRFKVEILVLADAQAHRFTRFWNTEAGFVVAGVNAYSISQQMDIFYYFSKFRIYNCIIVSREHYVTDTEYGRALKANDLDTGMKMGVYTWFPFQSSDRCTAVNDITLLDSWVISAQGHFTKNTDLFPRKISKSYNGCPMKAVVRYCHSYFNTKYVEYKNSSGSFMRYIIGLKLIY